MHTVVTDVPKMRCAASPRPVIVPWKALLERSHEQASSRKPLWSTLATRHTLALGVGGLLFWRERFGARYVAVRAGRGPGGVVSV